MKEVSCKKITEEVRRLCIEAGCFIPEDVIKKLTEMKNEETWPLAKSTLEMILENDEIAKNNVVPSCQDTGMVVAFVTIGQDVKIVDGYIEEAINEGIRQGYTDGFLRKSVLKDPVFHRENTGDNTPGIIHYKIVPGDVFNIMITSKGFGSENMSRIKMLKPSDGLEGVKDFVLETVEIAGPNPCPPIVVGIGIGGTMDKAALMAKHSLTRSIESENPIKEYDDLEKELLEMINKTGIGPQGYGGKTTALRVFIETYPTHLAGLPVAVNINCHASRHKEVDL